MNRNWKSNKLYGALGLGLLLVLLQAAYANSCIPEPVCVNEPYSITLGELYGVWTTSIENEYQRKATFTPADHVTEVAICFDPCGNSRSCGNSSIGGDGTFDLTGPNIEVTIDPSSAGPLLTEHFSVHKDSCTKEITMVDSDGYIYRKAELCSIPQEAYSPEPSDLYGTWEAYGGDDKVTIQFASVDKVTQTRICCANGGTFNCGNSSIGGEGTFDITGSTVEMTESSSSVGPLIVHTAQVYVNPCTDKLKLVSGSYTFNKKN